MARTAPKQSKYKLLERPKSDEFRQIGFGMAPDLAKINRAETKAASVSGLIDWVKDSVNCPIFNMPVIEQVRWGMDGPLSDASLTQNFGAEIDLFGSGKNAGPGITVETTMAQAGELQVHTLACAIFYHVEPDPMCWTAFGNAWACPAVGATNPNIPISPDVYTYNDLFNGCIGGSTSGATPAQAYGSAVLEWGWWSNYAAWHMVRGYDLRWKIGQHTNIMDEVLRHTAYMPTNGQEGSASNSEVDIINSVARVNQFYDGQPSPLNFLKVNRIRLGSVGFSSAAANLGIFRPSNDDVLVGATYGGMDIRSLLKGNSEFRKLTIPYVIKPGIAIGLVAQVNDEDQANTMRSYMAMSQIGNTYGNGIITPPVTDDEKIAASYDGSVTGAVSGNVALERTLDGGNVPQQVPTARYVFKGGNFKISMGIKGFEVTEDWYTILQNNPDLKNAVMSECSIRFATT